MISMKTKSFIIIWALIISTIATARSLAPRSASSGTCSLSPSGTFQSIVFTTYLDGYTIAGQGRTNRTYTDISFTVESNGSLVVQFEGDISAEGVFTTKWNFGPILGARTLTLTSINGTTEGMLDDKRLLPFTAAAPRFNFVEDIALMPLHIPDTLSSVSQVLPGALKSTLRSCNSPTLGKQWEEMIAPTLLKRQQSFGSPGQIENTGSQSQCADCIAEAFAACAACGVACALTPFGLGCGCIAGEPLLFTQCHNPGNGLGQGCCPVGCGDYQTFLGITISYRCCQSGQSCLDPGRGLCCAEGTQPCNGKICCPSNAPCRDTGICCPTNQNTCGETCCSEGEICLNGGIDGGLCCNPAKACGYSTCCGTLETCADATLGMCCLDGQVNMDGICCYPKMTNCNGECCGGTCTATGCVFESNEQCIAIGASSVCSPSGTCAGPDQCIDGCCYIIPK